MTAADRHLEWRNFRTLIEAGVPANQRVSGSPPVFVYVDIGGSRIGLRVELSASSAAPPSPVAAIEIGRVRLDDTDFLQVSTTAETLYPEFYALIEDLADRIQLQGAAPFVALSETLSNWRALLRPVEHMATDQQCGLMGELLVLDRLVTEDPAMLDAWTGPLAEPHDFRLGAIELEVKTTMQRRRVHMISSLDQLAPSPGHELALVSIQLEPAGYLAGRSLPEQVDRIRGHLAAHIDRLSKFEAVLLAGWRYSDVHSPYYSDRYQMRSPLKVIPVDDQFPRLTASMLHSLPNANRIVDVQYRIDVEGMGAQDGDPSVAAVLPGLTEL